MRTHHRVVQLTAGAATAVLLALALPARAGEPGGGEEARFRFGGGLALAAPTGEFARHVDVAGGLSGVALYGRPHSPLALRADAGWLLYGTRTLRRAIPGTGGRVLEDVATTDNWIAQVALGPQLMARSGRVRPYANAFAGASYFATSSELVRPRPSVTLVAPAPGGPVLLVGQDPFRTTTHFDDVIASYGAGTGVLIGLGGGGTALDVGVRYVANGRVRFLAEGDPLDVTPRRSEGHLFEFRVGVLGLR